MSLLVVQFFKEENKAGKSIIWRLTFLDKFDRQISFTAQDVNSYFYFVSLF